MKQVVLVQTILLCTLVAIPEHAFAMASTSQIASEGTPVHEETAQNLGWPEGVLDLVNDPARRNGWNDYFSELPNDVHVYEIWVRSSEDVERILSRLRNIECDVVRVMLSPSLGMIGSPFISRSLAENSAAASFTIGSQRVVDDWFQRLEKNVAGEREFGVHRYTEPPTARPPTLTLCVGNPAVKLDELNIPLEVIVKAHGSEHYLEEHKDEPDFIAIESFIKNHEAKRKGALQDEASEGVKND